MPPSFRRECGHLPLCEPRRAKGCHCLESVVLLISTNLYLKDAVTSHPYKPVLTRTHLYLKDAITFFRSAKHEKEDVARSLAMQCIPFPRLHFFMLSTEHLGDMSFSDGDSVDTAEQFLQMLLDNFWVLRLT